MVLSILDPVMDTVLVGVALVVTVLDGAVPVFLVVHIIPVILVQVGAVPVSLAVHIILAIPVLAGQLRRPLHLWPTK